MSIGYLNSQEREEIDSWLNTNSLLTIKCKEGKMEQQELEKEIGTVEPEKKDALEPKKVKIVKVDFRDTKKGKIISCESKHPDKEENIHISSVAFLKNKQVVTSGLWYSLDKEQNIQKASALAVFMQKIEASKLKDIEGKEVETELDEDQWLCFKAY